MQSPDNASPKPTCGHPKYSDQFWYVDRKFFDRSGWDDINLQAAPTIDNVRDLDPILLNELYGYIDTDSNYSANGSDSDSESGDSV